MDNQSTHADLALKVIDLGRLGYTNAFARQQAIHADVAAGRQADTLLLVEHDPVVTVGKRPEARKNLLATPDLLARAGVQLCTTNRGGDITYHGPGQIVAYPIVRLNPRAMNLRQYVWTLEQAIVDCLVGFGVKTGRDKCAVGVWTVDRPSAKIAAIGVRASQWVTMHGLALNVCPNMDHFKLIVPCGLAGRPVTSMQQLLGEQCPSIDTVKQSLADILARSLGQRYAADTTLPGRN